MDECGLDTVDGVDYQGRIHSTAQCPSKEHNEKKIKENFDVFHWKIHQDLCAKISEIHQIDQVESEFASYKVRAHSLLQKKEEKLVAVRDSEQLKAHEEALKEAEREILSISAEKDKALQDLKNVDQLSDGNCHQDTPMMLQVTTEDAVRTCLVVPKTAF